MTRTITDGSGKVGRPSFIRVTFWTPYPQRGGTIHAARADFLRVGEVFRFESDASSYEVLTAKLVDTSVYGRVTEFTFTATAETVAHWTKKLKLICRKEKA